MLAHLTYTYVKIPDPILCVAQPVGEVTDGTRQLLHDMAATMLTHQVLVSQLHKLILANAQGY